ncbi:hypothetical protein GPJ56_005286 [Histomonas meleagridis]|uniref:uncharacterized protein n=1 Tax=Histomonas meleagridis TaxID=135588 RepID=UPI00355AC29B|nr:hypothetical protein GPJ56_005286 [Histomonas meleagridis]KAH0802135.1 hypothetical protein GO595_005216 [Histomonas meleagridis]
MRASEDDAQSFFSTVTEDSSFLSTSETTQFYSAIFEYAQGKPPQILWDVGIPQFKSLDSFKFYIASTPFASQDEVFILKPTIILSSYENFHYIALYTQLFDIEARGFSRSIAYVIVHQSSEMIQNIYYTHLQKMVDLINSLQRKTIESASHDLSIYALQLEKTNEKYPENEPLFKSKLKELQLYLDCFNVKIDRTLQAEPKDVEFFSIIRNDLRPIFDITNFTGEFSKRFEDLHNEVSNLSFNGHVSSLGNYRESNPKICFGADNFPAFVAQMKSFSDEEKLTSNDEAIFEAVFRSEVFYHCSFSILSGKTLCIISTKNKLASYICERFSICIPFYKDNYIRIMPGTIESIDCLRYSIVVAEKINQQKGINLNVLDLDNLIYSGEKCPINSFIRKFDINDRTYSYNIFFKTLFLKLKTKSFAFMMKLAELGEQKNLQKDKIFSKSESGFTKDDEPILRYWILSYFNKSNLRPIYNGCAVEQPKAGEVKF